jgi:hypothetical protein
MAATANDLTRQQLDELDTLLQRMLTVPGAKPEATVTPLPEAPAGWRADPPSAAAAPHLNGDAFQLLADLAPLARLPQLPEPLIAPTPAETVGVLELPEELDALNLAELKPAPVEVALVPESPITAPAKISAKVMPLFMVNWMLEGTLKLFGPPGAMLTSRAGKNLLATAGILMMISAGLWTAQGFGAVKLPIDKVLKR